MVTKYRTGNPVQPAGPRLQINWAATATVGCALLVGLVVGFAGGVAMSAPHRAASEGGLNPVEVAPEWVSQDQPSGQIGEAVSVTAAPVAAPLPIAQVPTHIDLQPCVNEDGSPWIGNCLWDATTRGNRTGDTFVVMNAPGEAYYHYVVIGHGTYEVTPDGLDLTEVDE